MSATHVATYYGHSTLDRKFPVGRSATGSRVGAYGTWRSYLSAVGISHGCATHLEPTPKPEVSTVCRHKCGRGTFHLLRKTARRRRGTECMGAWRDFRCVDVRIKHLKVAFYLLNNPYEVFASFRIFALSELTWAIKCIQHNILISLTSKIIFIRVERLESQLSE